MPVPQSVLDLLELREGFRRVVYCDTNGFATVGIGHKLLPDELKEYPDGTFVPEDILEAWFAKDSQKANDAAVIQAEEIGCSDERLSNALASVCFQLGVNWPSKFPTLFQFLKSHKWEQAAQNAFGTKWAKQTPVRVVDFATALFMLAGLSTDDATARIDAIVNPKENEQQNV